MAQTSPLYLSHRERRTLRRAADERLIDAIFGELFIVHRDEPASGRPMRPDASVLSTETHHLASTTAD